MAVSVRMDPLLEKELELAAKRQGITKSQFIVEAVQQALGRRDPYALMQQLKAEEAAGRYASGEAFAGAEKPYDRDRARKAIRAKLAKKHGVGRAG